MTRNALYADPKAYDILHAPGTHHEVNGLEKTERRFVTGAAKKAAPVWLEPACGSGRYLRLAAQRMQRRGRGRVIGYDLSDDMLDYARARAEKAGVGGRSTYLNADMTGSNGAIGDRSVTFAFNPINSFRHLMSDRDVLAHLEDMARVLKPGGVYALGLGLTCYGLEPPSEDTWEGARGTLHVRQIVNYTPADPKIRKETVYSHLILHTPTQTVHEPDTYHLRSYDRAQWDRLLARSAMTCVGEVDPWGNDEVVTEPGYGVFVLSPR